MDKLTSNDYITNKITLNFINPEIELVYRVSLRTKHRIFYLLGMILSFFSWIQLIFEIKNSTKFELFSFDGLLVFIFLIYLLILIVLLILKISPQNFHNLSALANFLAGHLIVYIGIDLISNPETPVYFMASITSFIMAVAFFAYFLLRIRFTVATFITVTYLIHSVIAIGINPMIPDDVKNFLITGPVSIFLIGIYGGYYFEKSSREVFIQKERITNLIHKMVPKEIAIRLETGEQNIADLHKDVTVLFADFKGFTPIVKSLKPKVVIKLLNEIFSEFDSQTIKVGGEKIKTIGDSYMVAFGVPSPVSSHADRAVTLGLNLINITKEYSVKYNLNLEIRVGIHSGEVIAGVIGEDKYIYDLWGDSVNLASRMESHGLPGYIQISNSTYIKLEDKNKFICRGKIKVKGWGDVTTWLLQPT